MSGKLSLSLRSKVRDAVLGAQDGVGDATTPIEDIFMLESEERIQIGDDAFEELKHVLLQRQDVMLASIAG